VNGIVRKFPLSLDGRPIYVREGSPDRETIDWVLVQENYAFVEQDVPDPRLIVDCGAYAGYSTLYFLTAYPNARVIALEPDERNFELCRRNLLHYGDRVTLMHAAVWPEPAELVLRKGELGDRRQWGTAVRLPRPGEKTDVRGVDVPEILRASGFAVIDLLKLDIVTSEEVLFSRNHERWLPRVKNILLGLNEKAGEDAFFGALSGFQFFLARRPSVVACTRMAPAVRTAGLDSPRQARNAVANGGFENLRVEAGRVDSTGWIAGSTDVAASWHVVVRDPQFHVDLAVRTGLQHSGENALHVKVKPAQPVLPHSSPYAAIENRHAVPVAAGERWRLAAFIKTAEDQPPPAGSTRGAYLFLRLRYTDDSYTDLRVEPLADVTNAYVEKEAIVTIPDPPRGASIARATIWLYAWIANPHDDELLTGANWDVMFDDVSCTQVAT